MSRGQDNLNELEKLFGKPGDGITGCYVEEVSNKIIGKGLVDTGYRIEGEFNSKIINPSGRKIAQIDSGVAQFIYVGNKRTDYNLGGELGCNFEYCGNFK